MVPPRFTLWFPHGSPYGSPTVHPMVHPRFTHGSCRVHGISDFPFCSCTVLNLLRFRPSPSQRTLTTASVLVFTILFQMQWSESLFGRWMKALIFNFEHIGYVYFFIIYYIWWFEKLVGLCDLSPDLIGGVELFGSH